MDNKNHASILVRDHLEVYNKAIGMLEDIGLRTVMYELEGERPFDGGKPCGINEAALEHAFLSGWRRCSNILFDLPGFIAKIESQEKGVIEGAEPDYGAKEKLKALGYSDDQLNLLK